MREEYGICNQETDFYFVEINTSHFDTVQFKCFVMESLKRSWIVMDFFKAQESMNLVSFLAVSTN